MRDLHEIVNEEPWEDALTAVGIQHSIIARGWALSFRLTDSDYLKMHHPDAELAKASKYICPEMAAGAYPAPARGRLQTRLVFFWSGVCLRVRGVRMNAEALLLSQLICLRPWRPGFHPDQCLPTRLYLSCFEHREYRPSCMQ